MPTSELTTVTDLRLALASSNVNPEGKVVVFMYDEEAPSFKELNRMFEHISRECSTTSKFHTMSMAVLSAACEEYGDDFFYLESLNIFSFPVFVVQGIEDFNHFETLTSQGLVQNMKKYGVLKEDANILSV